MLCGQKRFEFALQGGGLAWPLATNTSSHTAGGASCGSPKVFVFCMCVYACECVCEREIDRREIANNHSL